jgi:hypothetical protein
VTPRDDELAGRLGTPLPSERAAADRNWRALAARRDASRAPRSGGVRSFVAGAALVAAVLLALGWWQGARLEVAGDRLPVLYREEVARTGVTAPGIEATLVVLQKHVDGPSAGRLSVVAAPDVQLGADRLPAIIELRFQRPGDDSFGLLARSENLRDPRRATGTTRTAYEAPFPPLGSREQATYRIWLHIETASGAVDSPALVIHVTERPEGYRATGAGAP